MSKAVLPADSDDCRIYRFEMFLQLKHYTLIHDYYNDLQTITVLQTTKLLRHVNQVLKTVTTLFTLNSCNNEN